MDTPPLARDAWLALRWRTRGRSLWLEVEDSRGARAEPPRAGSGSAAWRSVADPPELGDWRSRLGGRFAPAGDLRVPADLERWVETFAAQMPQQPGPHGTGRVPLPLFVQGPPGLASPVWEDLAAAVLAGLDPDAVQFVSLPVRRWRPRTPFRLPLRILALDPLAVYALAGLRGMWWSQKDVVREHGLHLDSLDGRELDDVLRTEAYDVLLGDGAAVAEALARVAAEPPHGARRPRLFAVIEDAASRDHPLGLPPDASLLRISADGPDPGRVFTEFIYALIHDQPLHEAVKSAERSTGGSAFTRPRLVADPMSIHALRLSHSAKQLEHTAGAAAEEAEAWFEAVAEVAPAPVPQAAPRPRAIPPAPALRELMASAQAYASPVLEELHDAADVAHVFDQEVNGLLPLSSKEAQLKRARKSMHQVRRMAARAAGEVEVVEWLRERQERQVDVEVHARTGAPVPDDRPLEPGAAYRVRVRIGRRGKHSVVRGEVPSIDRLLEQFVPEDDGYALEVALFEKDFRLRGPRVRKLFLPHVGESPEPAEFVVEAPAAAGRYDMRIVVYYRNHTLQSFRFEADVGDADTRGDARPVEVRLDFSHTGEFANLGALQPRALTVGINQDAGGHSHSFMVKQEGAAEPLRLSEHAVQSAASRFRELLEDLTDGDGGGPRFPGYPPPGTAASDAFHEAVRRFADLGSELHEALFGRATNATAERLRTLRNERDRTIQVVRHDATLAFPWSILYDYPLSPAVTGAPPRPLCTGAPLPGLGAPPPGRRRRGCPHNPGHDVYCTEGFWGVRHRIEQLLDVGDASARDAVLHVARPEGGSGVRVALGVDDGATRTLTEKLRDALGANLQSVSEADDILGDLWEPARRPAVLVVLGHLETEPVAGEPNAPRILLVPRERLTGGAVPADKWLTPREVYDLALDRGRWGEQPRTIVLLMACGSGATDVATLTDFVLSLAATGPAAVVGTEATIFSDLAERFACQVTLDLWEGRSRLGAAVQHFNQSLIREGNPLGFAFTCYGNADLHLLPEAPH